MKQRTTIELDEDLLKRAKRALGVKTIRATVEEALRRAVEATESETDQRAARQHGYLLELADRADLKVLASDQMWR
jgi:Arc/MetJ family transcription regulator